MACNKKPFPTLVTRENCSSFIDAYDTFMFDCDGVVWAGNNVIDRANLVINHLQKLGKQVFFITNNSTKSLTTYETKCADLGFNMKKENILGASSILAGYLKGRGFTKRVYVIGSAGVEEELSSVGISCFGVGPDPMAGDMAWLGRNAELEQGVGAVVVGFDEHFSLPKLLKASSYIHNDPECLFLATNTDECFPWPDRNILYPGTGSMVKAVETVVGRPATVMGKPETRAFDTLKQRFGCKPDRTCMVGDRLNTDILMGSNCGIGTLLVLTGCHGKEDVQRRLDDGSEDMLKQVPDYYLPSLGTLLDLLEV